MHAICGLVMRLGKMYLHTLMITVDCSVFVASCQQNVNCLSQSGNLLIISMDSELCALVTGYCNNISKLEIRNVQTWNIQIGNPEISRMEWPFLATILVPLTNNNHTVLKSTSCIRRGRINKLRQIHLLLLQYAGAWQGGIAVIQYGV